MTTIEQQTMTDLEAFVWLGFRRDASLDFKVTLPREKDEARKVLEAAGCYNRFKPEEAFAIVDGWWDYAMRFELAREGSVALYVTFPWHLHQAISESTKGVWLTGRQVPIKPETSEAFAASVIAELLDIGAEELTYDKVTRTVRAWWD